MALKPPPKGGETRAPGASAAGTPAPKGGSAPIVTTSAPPERMEKIEEKVFSLPGYPPMKEAVPPPILKDFIDKFVPRFRTPGTMRLMLEAFSNIDVNAERVAQIISSNPYYEHHFLKFIASHGRKEAIDRLDSAVVLFGMQNSRNLVLALQALRMVRGGHPEWTPEGKLRTTPSEVLRYALRTEETLINRKDEYADTGYAAGLMFDLLALIAGELAHDKKKAVAFVDQVFQHSLRTGLIAFEIAKAFPELGYRKFIFSAGLLHDIGKVVMAILSPDYIPFAERAAKLGLTRYERHFAERRQFGLDHAFLGGLCCEFLPTFTSIGEAIQFHHEPYLLRGGKTGLGQLASLVCLSTNISNNFRKPSQSTDPVLQLWSGPEMRGFAVSPEELIEAVARVG